ncbi:MAG: tRNA (adenosine(37)-N6)-dimethylallyltransferase MiaA [Candidatus Nealsonbacteria bacterium CG23_combo_of_CG06-09_8_20_14_all_40_13]|uniref:tRNA dimethylallyltransferase n=1 Tax=Candidatus Nealsonbacteria bacterium CG23_combo_of_CG06-09_8_20_14_all_40_13 TaxID=1974724 RepID=A0A2G9YRN3_9BACT|nr:MAG: tRNA (adenosine(37)-N6)-dimethylallyltransferase MiaA [Candidatus Nealsonbacteria bacterium CG23_combo_of_CG06-09_8_20_14_all_40_13]PIR71110.1 MAG: tRNA (adenosine(37)-N6)-dimethylallyltransferase MiaA [Candidatus Nealsonbacteria bacterium CG10_big_fil_rev_8_21_14_0_10_40_24]PIU43397.1 MAG: tRNA (adenosine(37)-N6)-dimethylallyltransferase MiaA [Candidatus Nealsonbacteria bacterium CG07_land_8_20_14_0_80_40_10]
MKDTNQKKRANGTPKIVAIVGPTASDKTKLAIALAKKFNGELISADSRQIFKGMDIGTNKDKSYPQHLIDIVNPDEEFSVAQFQKMAYKLIGEILKRGKLPILVGGTGLYIDAVLYGYSIPPKTKESARLRQELERQDAQALWRKLQKLDSKSAVKIGPHNKRRIVRALEVTLLQKMPFSQLQNKRQVPFQALIIGINIPRVTLYQAIGDRVDAMIARGLVGETEKLAKKYSFDLPSMSSIGYKEIGQYLQKQISLKQAIDEIKQKTRNFARRQLTWFRRNKEIVWIENAEQAIDAVAYFLADQPRKICLKIYGNVLGVFFRASAQKLAQDLNLSGFAVNASDQTVEIVAEGQEANLNKFLKWCRQGPALAQVDKVEAQWGKFSGEFSSFEIR